MGLLQSRWTLSLARFACGHHLSRAAESKSAESLSPADAMPDTYESIEALCAVESEDVDFGVEVREVSDIAIIAPHGGGIEPGTSEIACEIAGAELSLYLFEGLKPSGNKVLHVTSSRFEEQRCVHLLEGCDVAVAIHGCADRDDSESSAFLGGLDTELRDRLIEALSKAGHPAEIDRELPGTNPSNICNRTRRGRGVQIEVAHHLRGKMFASLSKAGRQTKRNPFYTFCNAIRQVVTDQGRAA